MKILTPPLGNLATGMTKSVTNLDKNDGGTDFKVIKIRELLLFFLKKKKIVTNPQTYIYMSNDSLPHFYTTFYHIIYVVRWSLTLFYF
jgi:hypothetical protein